MPLEQRFQNLSENHVRAKNHLSCSHARPTALESPGMEIFTFSFWNSGGLEYYSWDLRAFLPKHFDNLILYSKL